MLQLNSTTLSQVVNSAKLSAANDQRWVNAIERAARELTENPYIEAIDDHTLLIGSASGQAYTANGSCQCRAFVNGRPCYHRAMSRLYQRYTEAQQRQAQRPSYAVAVAEMDELFPLNLPEE